MKLAYVTYQDTGTYVSDVENEDQALLKFLKAKGLDIHEEIWSDSDVRWESYDAAVLKSPWDYFDRIDEFYTWLEKMQKLDTRLLNPADIILWNSDKHYMKDIADAGLSVTPTHFIEKGETADLAPWFSFFKTDKLIVKPTVSGGSKNTFKFTLADVEKLNPEITALLRAEGFMLQPFMQEIEEEGEHSFLFFDGKFSHHLLKKAKPGDFRVQHYLGGSIHAEVAPSHLLEAAYKYVEKFAKGCLYARVDGLEINGEFMLMELELIEPFLFLFTSPESNENYYQALVKILNRKSFPEIVRR